MPNLGLDFREQICCITLTHPASEPLAAIDFPQASQRQTWFRKFALLHIRIIENPGSNGVMVQMLMLNMEETLFCCEGILSLAEKARLGYSSVGCRRLSPKT